MPANATNELILLVEDDMADARLVQRAFHKVGVNVPVFRLQDGDDAVAYLKGEPPFDNRISFPIPSVVILDIKLPRRNGFEVLQWIRGRSDGLRRLPIVMLTSSRHSGDITRAYDLGANSYLAKPDTAQQLTALAEGFRTYWLKLNEPPDLVTTAV